MRYTAILGFLMFSIPAFAQVIDELPTDENGIVNFNEVITIDSATKDELYVRAKQAFVNIFKSADDVIQMDDKEAGILMGKGYGTAIIDNGVMGKLPMKVWYTIRIQCRDGRYKYEIYNIYLGDVYRKNATAESLFDKKNYYKANGEPRIFNQKYKVAVLEQIESLTSVIKSQMVINETKKEDW